MFSGEMRSLPPSPIKRVAIIVSAILLVVSIVQLILMDHGGGTNSRDKTKESVLKETLLQVQKDKSAGVFDKLVGWLSIVNSERSCIPCDESDDYCYNGCSSKCIPCYWGADCYSGCRVVSGKTNVSSSSKKPPKPKVYLPRPARPSNPQAPYLTKYPEERTIVGGRLDRGLSSGSLAGRPRLPGSDLIGSGYDPLLHLGCRFEDCRTKRIIKWTRQKPVGHTRYSAFHVPDQVAYMWVDASSACSKVYASERDLQKEYGLAAGADVAYSLSKTSDLFGIFGTALNETRVAERRVSVQLYSLTLRSDASNALDDSFKQELLSLPPTFSESPSLWISFIRRWGRFVVLGGNFGGTLLIDMKYDTPASSSTASADATAELALDTVTASGTDEPSAKVSAQVPTASGEEQGAALQMLGKSEVSIYANGGSPGICSTISDVSSISDGPTFRKDVGRWVSSIPDYPRLTDVYPQLIPIADILPTGPVSALDQQLGRKYANLTGRSVEVPSEWGTVRHNLQQAVESLTADPDHSANLAELHCGCDDQPMCLQASAPPTFKWTDLNRVGVGSCVSFHARNTGNFSVALGNGGQDAFIFSVSPEQVELSYRSKIEASSSSPYGQAFTDSDLSARYFVCLSEQADDLRLDYGRGDYIVLTHHINQTSDPPPAYFALSCTDKTDFDSIKVSDRAEFAEEVSRAPCGVDHCDTVDVDSENCRCKACSAGFDLVRGGGACAPSMWVLLECADAEISCESRVIPDVVKVPGKRYMSWYYADVEGPRGQHVPVVSSQSNGEPTLDLFLLGSGSLPGRCDFEGGTVTLTAAVVAPSTCSLQPPASTETSVTETLNSSLGGGYVSNSSEGEHPTSGSNNTAGGDGPLEHVNSSTQPRSDNVSSTSEPFSSSVSSTSEPLPSSPQPSNVSIPEPANSDEGTLTPTIPSSVRVTANASSTQPGSNVTLSSTFMRENAHFESLQAGPETHSDVCCSDDSSLLDAWSALSAVRCDVEQGFALSSFEFVPCQEGEGSRLSYTCIYVGAIVPLSNLTSSASSASASASHNMPSPTKGLSYLGKLYNHTSESIITGLDVLVKAPAEGSNATHAEMVLEMGQVVGGLEPDERIRNSRIAGEGIHDLSRANLTDMQRLGVIGCGEGEVMSGLHFIDSSEITVWCRNILAYKACMTMHRSSNGKPVTTELPGVARRTLDGSSWSLIVIEELMAVGNRGGNVKRKMNNFKITVAPGLPSEQSPATFFLTGVRDPFIGEGVNVTVGGLVENTDTGGEEEGGLEQGFKLEGGHGIVFDLVYQVSDKAPNEVIDELVNKMSTLPVPSNKCASNGEAAV